MHWEKQGHIYAPTGEKSWARSYAHLPTAEVISDDVIRVYFASLDDNRYGRIGYVDLDSTDPRRIIAVSPEPILDLNEPGTFDDSGVNPSCILNINGVKHLYYIGWQRAERVPYMLFAGLAISDDGVDFRRTSSVPILDRTRSEPYLRSAVTILVDEGKFRMWYVSGLGWTQVREQIYPTYVIRHAVSTDGYHWDPKGDRCIDFQNDEEFGFGRPWVVRAPEGHLQMWYSIRSRTAPYRIGYAESSDGFSWIRKDGDVGIAASESGWDSEMICYPCVIDAGGKRYMFYNGNGHGRTGFGYAILAR
jgi:hypothetical protein